MKNDEFFKNENCKNSLYDLKTHDDHEKEIEILKNSSNSSKKRTSKTEDSLSFNLDYKEDIIVAFQNNSSDSPINFFNDQNLNEKNQEAEEKKVNSSNASDGFEKEGFIIDSNYPINFEKFQKNVNWMMRAILVDWLMQVSQKFSFKRTTFHSSVNYVDSYLSKEINIQKRELQLLGLTSIYIVAKREVKKIKT